MHMHTQLLCRPCCVTIIETLSQKAKEQLLKELARVFLGHSRLILLLLLFVLCHSEIEVVWEASTFLQVVERYHNNNGVSLKPRVEWPVFTNNVWLRIRRFVSVSAFTRQSCLIMDIRVLEHVPISSCSAKSVQDRALYAVYRLARYLLQDHTS